MDSLEQAYRTLFLLNEKILQQKNVDKKFKHNFDERIDDLNEWLVDNGFKLQAANDGTLMIALPFEQYDLLQRRLDLLIQQYKQKLEEIKVLADRFAYSAWQTPYELVAKMSTIQQAFEEKECVKKMIEHTVQARKTSDDVRNTRER